MSTTRTTPDDVTTVTLEDGRRLSYGPAATETGDAADGFDWTCYSADDEVEAQGWEPTEEQMAAVVAGFDSLRYYLEVADSGAIGGLNADLADLGVQATASQAGRLGYEVRYWTDRDAAEEVADGLEARGWYARVETEDLS